MTEFDETTATATGTEQAGAEPQTTDPAPAEQQGAEPAQAPAGEQEHGEEHSLADMIKSKLDEMETDKGTGKGEEDDSGYLSTNISDEKAAEQKAKTDAGAGQKKPEEQAAGEKKPEGEAPAKDADQEEKELLAMAQNERSKARLQQVFKERKEGMQAKQSLGTLVQAFAEAGYDQDSVNTMLVLGRKISSNDPAQIREAIDALGRIRSNLCLQIGEEPLPFDPLTDYPDLKKQVEEYSITREQALQLAGARSIQAEQKARQEAAQRAQVEQAQMAERVNAGKAAIGNFFYSKRGEMDYAAKMRALQAHLTPERVKHFVENVPPEMWAAQVEVMYNNIGTGSVRPANAPRPISSRQASFGRAAGSSGGSLKDDIVAKMSAMGI